MTDENKKGDCYAAGERGFMEWGQKIRHKLLHPALNILHNAGITSNHITLASLITGIIGAGLLVWNKPAGLCFLLLHVLLDGCDGPLARHSNTASPKGSFTDTAADQLVIIAVMIALMKLDTVEPAVAIIYVTSYTVVVGFAMIRNTLNIPYSWLVRPRFILYIWLPFEFWLFPQTLNMLLWLCNALLVWKCITGFYRIRRKI